MGRPMDDSLPEELQLAFAPLHKRAFGVALGIATGLVCFAITTVYLIRAPEPPFQLALLAEYFYGFTVSWRGAVVALAWGFFVGFVAGWFVAFWRNLTITTLLFLTRTPPEPPLTRTFLDHICIHPRTTPDR